MYSVFITCKCRIWQMMYIRNVCVSSSLAVCHWFNYLSQPSHRRLFRSGFNHWNKNFALQIEAGPHPGIVNTTDHYCDQQVRASHFVYNSWRRSCSVYSSCSLTPSRTGGCINICTYFVWNRNNSQGSVYRRIWIRQQNQRCTPTSS